MDSGASSDGHVPATNRACQNCARVKARCIPQTDGTNEKCVRCFRLKRECVTIPRKVRKKRSPNHATGVAQLEEKIQSLVSILAGAKAGILNPDNPSPSSSQNGSHTEPEPEQAGSRGSSSTNGSASYHRYPSSHKTPPSEELGDCQRAQTRAYLHETIHEPSIQPLPERGSAANPPLLSITAPYEQQSPFNDHPGPTEDWLLKRFKDKFSSNYPFVNIAPEMNASDLFSKRPWVYKAAMLVAFQSRRARQLEMSKHMTVEIATALLVKGERNLDMLQGLLIHNAWHYFYSPTRPNSQSTAIFQIAHTVAFDLGLSKPARDCLEDVAETSKFMPEYNVLETKRTPEERRTLLALFYSSSLISLSLWRMEGLQHTPYIDHNCKMLLESAECESDIILVALVRSQCISQSYHMTIMNATSAPDGSKVPGWMYIKSALAELHTFWASLTSEIRSNRLLLSAYRRTEMFIYGPSIHPSLYAISFESAGSQRLDMLYSCLISCQALLDLFIGAPLSEYYTLSTAELSDIGRGIALLYKLSIIEDPGWDLPHVRKTVNLLDYFDGIVSKFEAVGNAIDQNQEEPCRFSFHTGCSLAMKRVRAAYEVKLAPGLGQQDIQGQMGFGDMDTTMDLEQLDWIRDSYWQELIADMNFVQ